MIDQFRMLGIPQDQYHKKVQLITKYANQLKNVENPALVEILEGIEILDIDEGKLSRTQNRFTIGVGRSTPINKILEVVKDFELNHFVQSNRPDFFFDLFASALMLKKPNRFIKNPLPFFIYNFKKDLVKNHTVRSEIFSFISSAQKGEILKKLEKFLLGNSLTQNYVETGLLVADELITNALYNAPQDDDSRPLYIDKPRNFEVQLDTTQECKLFVTHDNFRLLIGCTDVFGSFNKNKVIFRLSDLYSTEMAKVDTKNPGSGLGLKMIIDNCCGFYLVFRKNIQSFVCASIPISLSYKESELMPKNIHFCEF